MPVLGWVLLITFLSYSLLYGNNPSQIAKVIGRITVAK
jgi:hypothetical protein